MLWTPREYVGEMNSGGEQCLSAQSTVTCKKDGMTYDVGANSQLAWSLFACGAQQALGGTWKLSH